MAHALSKIGAFYIYLSNFMMVFCSFLRDRLQPQLTELCYMKRVSFFLDQQLT